MSHVTFKGNLRNELHDAKQKQTIITDGPKSHGGLEETYSPVELLADTYASCAITIMAAGLRPDRNLCRYGNVRQRERLPDRTHRRPFPYAQIPR